MLQDIAKSGAASRKTKQQLISGGFGLPCSTLGLEDEVIPGGEMNGNLPWLLITRLSLEETQGMLSSAT